MRDDFAMLILTHGRPNGVVTLKALDEAGYTGKVYLVVDDEDAQLDEYKRVHGDRVAVFSKRDAEPFDVGDNFGGRRGVIYARNESWQIARSLGLTWFMQLDDDYTGFHYRFTGDLRYVYRPMRNIDQAIHAMVEYMASTPFHSIAMMQNGDYQGGGESRSIVTISGRGRARKAMNSFLCHVDRPFKFIGRINEDTTTYSTEQRAGRCLFLSLYQVSLRQTNTQKNPGGMTGLYLDHGTYVKTFYSVMFGPSCVSVGAVGMVDPRLHHKVNYKACTPYFVPETCRKARA
jgi:hypothetical protein